MPHVQVRELLKDTSRLKSDPEGVTVLDGTQEGAYQWVCPAFFPVFVNGLP